MTTLKPKKGRLLIADPTILDDNSFNRSIILLTEYTKNSTVGFIFNKKLNYIVQDFFPKIKCNFSIYQGGPVEQDNLYFVHRVPHLIPNSIKVDKDIFWGGDFNSLKELLENQKLKPSEIRFFLGYSGWEEQQLENEITNNSWFVSENDFSNILSPNNTSLWKNKLLQKGGKYKIWANAPSNYYLN